MPCQFCDKATHAPKFCSIACQQAYYWKCRRADYEAAGRVLSEDPRTARRYLMEVRGRRCELCGLDTWRDSPIPLVLDHIDGDASNWVITNLRLICPHCDAQLPTFKSKNWGKGRVKRRERYAAGLSY